jgi:hypothetical protein
VQNYGVNLDFDLFLQRKNGGLSPRVVDRWCFRSTMDPRAERNRSSASGRSGAQGHRLRVWGGGGGVRKPVGGLT